MPITMTRGIQVPLALPTAPATTPAGAPATPNPRRRVRPAMPRRRPEPRFCDNCRGPVATGEGFLTCVVCGLRRAA